MILDELQSQFVAHREQFVDHRARVETKLEELEANLKHHEEEMTEALCGMRKHMKELSEKMPANGWRAKAAVGGGTGGALLLVHFLAKLLGYEI